MKERKYEVFYDEEGDFLEIYFGEPSKCSADEIEDGVFVRRDQKTNEIKSIEIFGFRKRTLILKQILERLHLAFPLEINIQK